MDPAAVVGLVGRVQVAGVVQRAHLVAQIDQRQAARAQDRAEQQQHPLHRQRVALLQTGQRGEGAAHAGIARVGVLLEGDAAREAAGEAVVVEPVQELAVVVAVDAELGGILVGKGPADVVVAAHIVHPGRVVRQVVPFLQCLLQQVHLAGGQRVPLQCHLQRVVRQLALLRRDVGHHLGRMHDGFGLEEQGRRGDPGQCVEGTDQVVHLGQALAGRARALPDEGHRVQTQDLGAQVGNGQHLARHRIEHRRIAVVQVPLERVEGRPDPAAVGQLREGTPVLVREDLAHRALIDVRLGAVGEQEIEVLVGGVILHRGLCPGVVVGRVVEDEVQHQADAFLAQGLGQRPQVLDRADLGVHVTVAADRIAAVAVARGNLERGHQVQVGQPQLLEVGNLVLQILEVAGEAVHIEDAAHYLLRLEPGGVLLPSLVQRLHLLRALGPARPGRLDQRVKLRQEVRTMPVEGLQIVQQRRKMGSQSILELLPLSTGGLAAQTVHQRVSHMFESQGLLLFQCQHGHARPAGGCVMHIHENEVGRDTRPPSWCRALLPDRTRRSHVRNPNVATRHIAKMYYARG